MSKYTSPRLLAESDREWAEGKSMLLTLLVRERAKRLAQAKRSRFKREHGKLLCERCKLDPVELYGSADGEGCIDVHHSDVHVSKMGRGHKTNLADFECLSANCHRFAHRQLTTDAMKTSN